MCLETLRLMRATRDGQDEKTVGVTSEQLISGDANRVSLVISAPSVGRLTLSFKDSAVLDEGITLHAGQAPLVLSLFANGGVVRRRISAIASLAATKTSIWTSTLDRQ